MVVGDLAEMGYDAQWCRISALDAGAPHKRDRIWVVAQDVDNAISERREPGRLYHREDDGNQLSAAGKYAIQNPVICTAAGYGN